MSTVLGHRAGSCHLCINFAPSHLINLKLEQMSLPPDVLDLILSFLQGDHAALRVCSRCHPMLSRLAERYSYAHITVDESATIKSEIQVDVKLTAVLSRRPRIANYVRTLEIRIASDSPLFFSQAFLTIFPWLPCLTKITLSSDSEHESIRWRSLPESLRTALVGSFHLPSIKGISIRWIAGFPLSELNSCNTVEDLTLEGWSFNGVNMTPDDVNRPLLESLSIRRCCGEILHRIITWAPTRHLRALELSRLWNPRDYAMVPKFLSNSSNSLTSLNVDLGTCCASHSCWPQFTNMPISTQIPLRVFNSSEAGTFPSPFLLSHDLSTLQFVPT